MPPREKNEKNYAECRKDLHCKAQSIASIVTLASVYQNKDAFGKACVHAAADVTGPTTWRARYLGHGKWAALFRARFLSGGTKGLNKTLIMAAAASVAVGAVAGPVAGGSVVALAAARKLAARLEARGLFSPEGEELRGPVLEQARKTMGRLYPNMNFGFTTASTFQVMTSLAVGTPKLRDALPEATPLANCKWGWVSNYVCLDGILGKQFDYICDAADAIRSTLKEMNDAADIVEPLKAAARNLETARLSNSHDALTSAFDELRAIGVDVSSGDADVIATKLKERLEPATALFIAKRDAARVILTGTTDDIMARETTGDGTGLSRRYVAPDLSHITKILDEYDQDMGEDAIKNEEAGLKHFTKGRDEAMKVAETVGIEFIAQPGAVTLGGLKDLKNRKPLLAGPGNSKGLVKGVIKPEDVLTSTEFLPNRPQLETDMAKLVVVIRLMTLFRVGLLVMGLPEDLADIFLTSSAVQSYLKIFFHVAKPDSIDYGKAKGTLVAGVCTRFMWRRLGSDDDWTPLDRGLASTEDKGYPSFSGADWPDAPTVGSYGVLGRSVDVIWTDQCALDADNVDENETQRKLILDAKRATYVADALEEATTGTSRPKFIIEDEDGALRSLRIGVKGTGYNAESKVVHDPELETSFDALARGGAEFVLSGHDVRAFDSDVDLVVVPMKTNWMNFRDNAGEFYELKAGHKILVLERLLEDLASYVGDDFLGDAALREKSSAFELNGTVRMGTYKGKPRYVVKEELKTLEKARFDAGLLKHNSTVRHWMTSQGVEPPVTGLTWYASNIEQAKAVCADVNASAEERRVAQAILDDDAETTRAREALDLDPNAAVEDGYADAQQLQAHAAFLRSLEPGGEEAAPAAPPSFRLDRSNWRLPSGEGEWKETKQTDIDWKALTRKAQQVPTPPAPWWSPEDVEGLEPDEEKVDSGDESDGDVGIAFF